jgi:HEPN domain-containing protein
MSDLVTAMWRQAMRDLDHARSDLAAAYHEWSAYSAQQSAEKAMKAVLLAAGRTAPQIHGLNRLMDALVGAGLATPDDKRALQKDLSALDQIYGIACYPVADIAVAPADLIDADQAEAAIASAERLLTFARSRGIETA